MDAADLRVFETVARLGGMGRAAGELNTVQSNVTARIRLLEQEIALPLFVRHSRGVRLTEAGQRLLPYARRVGRLLDDALRAARDEGRPAGPLVIGSLETSAALRLSPFLSEFVACHPDVDLVLRTGTTEEMVTATLAHDVEGAFVCGPIDHPDLQGETIFPEELVLVSAPGVRRLKDVMTAGGARIVVLRAGCSYRQRLEEILARRGIVGLRRLEFGTIEALIGCAAAGLGLTLLPRGIAEPARRAGRVALHDLPPAEAHVETLFVRRRDAYVSSALAAFVDHARRAFAQADAAE